MSQSYILLFNYTGYPDIIFALTNNQNFVLSLFQIQFGWKLNGYIYCIRLLFLRSIFCM